MPKDFFSIDRVTSLGKIKSGGNIHVIGVAGVAMAQLAILLTKKGYKVSGSDKEFYEPMGSLLSSSSVKIYKGYKAENVSLDVDLVVIGNAVSYEHPEVSVVEERSLAYTCFPALLYESIIERHHSIVVAGTHGKSTTTAMIAATLLKLNTDPSYFVGGIAQDLPESLNEGRGKFSVVEGDEYDSAFFAKVPKFKFYKPDTAIINAIEFDHGDIYSDIHAIKKEFDNLARSLPKDGNLICCLDFKEVRNLVAVWKKELSCKVITFGTDQEADYKIINRKQKGKIQHITLDSKNGSFDIDISLIGEYNARNALACYIALLLQGFDSKLITESLKSFKSVKRRQEILFASEEITLIEDFAHHPTAVLQTLQAVSESYPDKEIWAVFEPRSATSRRQIFQADYIQALSKSKRALILNVQSKRVVDQGHELMDVNQICKKLTILGTKAESFLNIDDIFNILISSAKENRVIVVMSNGGFGGLLDKLKAYFKST